MPVVENKLNQYGIVEFFNDTSVNCLPPLNSVPTRDRPVAVPHTAASDVRTQKPYQHAWSGARAAFYAFLANQRFLAGVAVGNIIDHIFMNHIYGESLFCAEAAELLGISVLFFGFDANQMLRQSLAVVQASLAYLSHVKTKLKINDLNSFCSEILYLSQYQIGAMLLHGLTALEVKNHPLADTGKLGSTAYDYISARVQNGVSAKDVCREIKELHCRHTIQTLLFGLSLDLGDLQDCRSDQTGNASDFIRRPASSAIKDIQNWLNEAVVQEVVACLKLMDESGEPAQQTFLKICRIPRHQMRVVALGLEPKSIPNGLDTIYFAYFEFLATYGRESAVAAWPEILRIKKYKVYALLRAKLQLKDADKLDAYFAPDDEERALILIKYLSRGDLTKISPNLTLYQMYVMAHYPVSLQAVSGFAGNKLPDGWRDLIRSRDLKSYLTSTTPTPLDENQICNILEEIMATNLKPASFDTTTPSDSILAQLSQEEKKELRSFSNNKNFLSLAYKSLAELVNYYLFIHSPRSEGMNIAQLRNICGAKSPIDFLARRRNYAKVACEVALRFACPQVTKSTKPNPTSGIADSIAHCIAEYLDYKSVEELARVNKSTFFAAREASKSACLPKVVWAGPGGISPPKVLTLDLVN